MSAASPDTGCPAQDLLAHYQLASSNCSRFAYRVAYAASLEIGLQADIDDLDETITEKSKFIAEAIGDEEACPSHAL